MRPEASNVLRRQQAEAYRNKFENVHSVLMITLATLIGLAAAVCTTVANIPQLKKAWITGETDDLSLKTLLLLASGLGLWVAYGVLQEDMVIIVANSISLALAVALISLKLLHSSSSQP